MSIPAKAPLAVTMGEPAGIGGELTLAAWRNRTAGSGLPCFYAIDCPRRLRDLAARLALPVPIQELDDVRQAPAVFPHALPVFPVALAGTPVPGQPDSAQAGAVLESIRLAVAHALSGMARAIVTNPVQKASLYSAGFAHPGHTEYLAELAGGTATPVMMLAVDGLRVVPVTVHLPLRDAVTALSVERIVTAGRITAAALTADFGLPAPRLAVAALNPHAGEGGSLGHEETAIILPATRLLRQHGIDCTSPLPADTLFHETARAGYDAVLCMYHDQALIPLKTLDFWAGVNITLGLPIVRTSPDHGTALEIAGSGRANPASFFAALRQAAAIADRRSARSAGPVAA